MIMTKTQRTLLAAAFCLTAWATGDAAGAPYIRQSGQYTAYPGSTSNNWNVTLTNVLPGSTIYVIGTWPNFSSPYPTMAVTDGVNAYTQLDRYADKNFLSLGIMGTQTLAHWYAANVAGGTYTVNMAPTPYTWEDYAAVVAFEVAGVSATPLAGHALNFQAAVPPGSNTVEATVTTAGTSGLLIALAFDDVAGTPPATPLTGAGFTNGSASGTLWDFYKKGDSSASAEFAPISCAGTWTATFSPEETGAQLPDYLTAAAIFTSGTASAGERVPLLRDFNGDGTSDILWRNSNGDVVIWFMQGGTIGSSADMGVIPAAWSIAGSGNFGGNCKSDILWRNASGDTVVWLMSAGTITSSTDLGVIPAAWTIAGTGDFNGDGTTDILWQNSNGDTVIWFMQAGSIASSTDLGVMPAAWSIAGTGDFNGDGTTDILWRNANGDTLIWFMQGGAIAYPTDLGVIPPAWTIAGTGDFNGDGTSDILWQNSSGDTVIWSMQDGTIASSTDFGVIAAAWSIAGTGDFNGDGTTDILWRNSNGDVAPWFMQNGAIGSSGDLGVIPASWALVP